MSYSLGTTSADMTFTVAETVETNYRAGVEALRATPPRNTEALQLFTDAYNAQPNPRGLIGIGIALQRLKRWSEARARFQRYLREEPDGPLAAQARRHIAETTAALEASGASGPKPPPSQMDPTAYAAARSRTPDQIAAGTALPPTLHLRGSGGLSTPAMLAIAAAGLLGIGAIVWAVARR